MKIYNQRKQKQKRIWLRNNNLKPERIIWYRIRGKQLDYKFRRQHGVGSYIVDFYCPELKLIIEIDGGVHTETEIFEKDLIREKVLINQGHFIKRYRAADILKNLDSVILDLKNYCDNLNKGNPS